MKNWLKVNWFKVAILVVVIGCIITGVVLYQNQVNQKNAAAGEKLYTQDMNATQLKGCLSDVETDYSILWAADCQTQETNNAAGYKNCVEEGLEASACAGIWSNTDGSASCSLKTATSDSVNQQLQNDKDNCFKQFPTN